MSLPITARVKRAPKKGCGCTGACSCKKTPAKKALVGNQNQLPQKLQNFIKAAPESTGKMLGTVKRKYGAKAVAKKSCGMKY